MICQIIKYINNSRKKKELHFISVLFVIIINTLPVYSITQRVDDINFSITRIRNFPLNKEINKNYDLYELYLENKSDKTFSIPGYSIDFGVTYFNIVELSAQVRSIFSKKLTLIDFAAGAILLPFGNITGKAARTAINSVTNFKKRKLDLYDSENLLSKEKTYIFYPHEIKIFYFLISNENNLIPNKFRFICKNEETGQSFVVINNSISLKEISLSIEGKIKKKYEDVDFPVEKTRVNNLYLDEDEDLLVDPNESKYK